MPDRSIVRGNFHIDVRMALAEGDLDRQEAQLDQQDKLISSYNRLVVGAVVSTSTAIVLGALNILFGKV